MPESPPPEWIDWLAGGTAAFAEAAGGVDLTAPSLLPGWRRAHVVAHVAGNARGIANLLSWARTGVVTPMYASREQRDADIESDALLGRAALLARLAEDAAVLDEAVAAMPPPAWGATVQMANGREVTARYTIWMRLRELWIHLVDLAGESDFSDLPSALAKVMLDEIIATMSAAPGCPGLDIELLGESGGGSHGRDGAGALELGAPPRMGVSGRLGDVLAWVTGRGDGTPLRCESALPELPHWM